MFIQNMRNICGDAGAAEREGTEGSWEREGSNNLGNGHRKILCPSLEQVGVICMPLAGNIITTHNNPTPTYVA
jgi:hypothetical protein